MGRGVLVLDFWRFLASVCYLIINTLDVSSIHHGVETRFVFGHPVHCPRLDSFGICWKE